MRKRRLGRNGPEVSAVGLGCMGMSISYGEPDDVESIATIHRAIDLGVNLLVTSDAKRKYLPYLMINMLGLKPHSRPNLRP